MMVSHPARKISTDVTYWGAHIGVGREIKLNKTAVLDLTKLTVEQVKEIGKKNALILYFVYAPGLCRELFYVYYD